MKLRQKRLKLKCDNCSKETGWEVLLLDNPIPLDISNGWITGHDITGGEAMIKVDQSLDYCSVKCLHEAIDKYFSDPESDSTFISRSDKLYNAIKETREVCNHCDGKGCHSCDGDGFEIIKGGGVDP